MHGMGRVSCATFSAAIGEIKHKTEEPTYTNLVKWKEKTTPCGIPSDLLIRCKKADRLSQSILFKEHDTLGI
jgi:hypothetical protein